ncbi:MAG: hypothetical protein AAGF90_09940, partial [Pseudomonadota bacterium]
MLRRLFTRALTTLNSPTADLYFANACADWLEDGRAIRYAPTVFASETTRLVIRHDGRAGPASKRPRTVYLIDDAVDLDGADDALSPFWRFKLERVERAAAGALLPAAAAAVVSSPALAEMIRARSPETPVHVIDPYWSEPLSALKHHREDGPLRVAYLGSEPHRPDIEPLAPTLAAFLDETEGAELILAGGHEALAPFSAHPRVRALGPLPWVEYRRRLLTLRPHVALYPLRETPFNAARSLNKLIEHGVAGAAGLYAACWPGAALAEEAGAGMALPDDPR